MTLDQKPRNIINRGGSTNRVTAFRDKKSMDLASNKDFIKNLEAKY